MQNKGGRVYTFDKIDLKIFKEVSIGGRFGKYGDASRKIRLRDPDLQ